MVRRFLYTQRRGFDILTLARDLRMLRVVVRHVARAAATGGVHILFDCGRLEVDVCRLVLLCVYVSWVFRQFGSAWGEKDRSWIQRTCASAAVRYASHDCKLGCVWCAEAKAC